MRELLMDETGSVVGGGDNGAGSYLQLTGGIGTIGGGVAITVAGGGAVVTPAVPATIGLFGIGASAGTPATMIGVGSVPLMVTVGACGCAAAGGYLVGDFIEQNTGIGSSVGTWIGSTTIGSYLFNW